MKSFLKATVVAASMALGAFGFGVAPAAAATITSTSATLGGADVGTSFTVDFVCSAAVPCNGGSPGWPLGARATFTLTGYTVDGSETWWDFEVVIRNTSFLQSAAFLTGLGFASDPNAVLDSVWNANSDGINWSGGAGSIPGFSQTELCVWNGNNCSAANEHDMAPATQDRMGFTLTTGLINALTLSDFAVKWAGAQPTGSSYEAGGAIRVAPVPLPAAGGLLLLGLGGLAMLRRGRKAA